MDGSTSDPYTPALQFGYDGVALTGCATAPPGDSDSYPIGRRNSMCDGSGGTSWTHDPMGRVLQERRKIGPASTTAKYITYVYNLDGSLASLTTPPMKTVSYTYSGAARATQLVDSGDSINFVTGATYAPPGELTGMVLGSASGFAGITTNNAYNDRLQPILLSATSPTATIFSECFDFHLGVAVTQPAPCSFSATTLGDNGNVYTVVNNRDSTRTQSFTYDTLNRITSGQSSGTQWGETFTIDAWSNLTNETEMSGKANYEGLNTSAGVNNQLSGFGYDAAGNMTSNGSVSYVYDAENRLVWTSGYRYIYDGTGERVEKCAVASATTACPASGTTGTLYWRGTGSDTLDESDLGGNAEEEYIFFNGQRIARRDVSSTGATIAVHYYFSDHLGSHSVVENATGTVCEQDIDYYPYGRQENDYCPTVAQHYKFTGKERDSETGLDNFGARYNASSLGRFMSPDPIGIMKQKLPDPQRWNMYAYVRNNPLRFTDPTGMFTCSGSIGDCYKAQNTTTVPFLNSQSVTSKDGSTTTTTNTLTNVTFSETGKFLRATQSTITEVYDNTKQSLSSVKATDPTSISEKQAAGTVGTLAFNNARASALPSFATQFARAVGRDVYYHPFRTIGRAIAIGALTIDPPTSPLGAGLVVGGAAADLGESVQHATEEQ